MTYARFPRWPVLASMMVLLAGCAAGSSDRAAYVWPTPFSADPPKTAFSVRYSELWNSADEVRALIAGQCGPGVTTARVIDRPREGTVMHPHQLEVVCGDPPPRTSDLLFVPVDQGVLIRLDDRPPS